MTEQSGKSLGQVLRVQIERHFEGFKDRCPLMTGAKKGLITPAIIERYIANVYYLISHTPVFLNLAIRLCEPKGLRDLADFYKIKLKEEEGHEKWAEDDLLGLRKGFALPETNELSAPMKSLVDYIFQIIREDPYLYLAYIILAEHFTVLAAPSWLDDLERHCQIPRKLLSVIENHAELDKDHVVEMVCEIDRMVNPKVYRSRFIEVLETAESLHEQFCADVSATDVP